MTLTKENKAMVFEIVSDCDDNDLSYIRMVVDMRVKELDAAKPRGMKVRKGFFGL